MYILHFTSYNNTGYQNITGDIAIVTDDNSCNYNE